MLYRNLINLEKVCKLAPLYLLPMDESSAVEGIMARLRPLEVADGDSAGWTYGCDPETLGQTALGLSRPSQVLAAAESSSTRYREYAQDDIRFFIGVKRVDGSRRDFLLVLLGFGQGRQRQVVTALRLYPTAGEMDALLDSPSLALATIVARYGVEYEIAGGKRAIFEPIVSFERGRFPIHGVIEPDDLLEAFDLQGADDYSLIVVYRPSASGGVDAFFPIVLRRDTYELDVESARRA